MILHPRRRTRAAITVVFAACLAAVALGACALPVDRQPRAIDRPGLQRSLEPSLASTTTAALPSAQTINIYYVSDNQLVPVSRKINDRSALAVLRLVFSQPTAEETDAGISSFIPPQATVLGVKLTDHLLTVDVSKVMEDLGSPVNKTAYAQIVFTAVSALPEVRQVAVTIDGKPKKIPTDVGLVSVAGISNFNVSPPTTTLPATVVPTPTSPPS